MFHGVPRVVDRSTATGQQEHIRVSQTGDVLDDVVGPMVNRKTVVTAVRHGLKLVFRDIELEE